MDMDAGCGWDHSMEAGDRKRSGLVVPLSLWRVNGLSA